MSLLAVVGPTGSSAPAWESHLSLVASVIALVIGIVTLPTALQMFFGRPRLKIEFDQDRIEKITRLRCLVRNERVRNRFLRWLGVVRTPVEISADFGISEWRTGRKIVHLERATIVTDRQHGLHVDLPFSITPVRFLLVMHPENSEAFVHRDNGSHTGVTLSPGTYVAHVDIITAHQQIKTADHTFTVGVEANGTYWVGAAETP